MRKYLLLTILFLICSFSLFAELNKAQLWAISLTGLLTETNGSYRNSLNESEMDEKGINNWLDVLRVQWEINTREDLLETLTNLENEGHTASLREIIKIANEIAEAKNKSDFLDILFKHEWDQVKINRLKYILSNLEKYNNRTIRAWDLGRCISLCRWGYTVGFITEEEAWEIIFHFAKLIQKQYNSWEEYGYDYIMGRSFWLGRSLGTLGYVIDESGRIVRDLKESTYKRLLNIYWNWIDWNIDLELPETNQTPINTISFLKPDDDDGLFQYQTNNQATYNKWYSKSWENTNSDKNIFEYKVKKKSGDDEYGFGILFCVDDSDKNNVSYYRFFINVNGSFAISKYTNSVWTVPVGWRYSEHIKTGYNVYNKLKVIRDNNTFNIFINDNFVAQFVDYNPINSNKIGLAASINKMEREQFPYIPVDVRFDLIDNK